MHPSIGSVLDSFFNWKGSVVCPDIRFVGVIIQNARPNQHPTLDRIDGKVIQGWKLRPASFGNRVEIEEDCKNTGTFCPSNLLLNKIVVLLILLSFLVSQELPVLCVVCGDAKKNFKSLRHFLDHCVVEAVSTAPSVGRGSTLRLHLSKGTISFWTSHVSRALKTTNVALFNQVFAFLDTEEFI